MWCVQILVLLQSEISIPADMTCVLVSSRKIHSHNLLPCLLAGKDGPWCLHTHFQDVTEFIMIIGAVLEKKLD